MNTIEGILPNEHDNKKYSHELFSLIQSLYDKLGPRKRVLDHYLPLLTEVAGNITIDTAAEYGRKSAEEIRDIFISVENGFAYKITNPFFDEIIEFIRSHPLPCREPATRGYINFCKYILQKHKDNDPGHYSSYILSIGLKLNMVYLERLYTTICMIIGSKHEMDRLNQIVSCITVGSAPLDAFLEAQRKLVEKTLFITDPETGKPINKLIK
ncbi:MAG TPA: hypothetical protein PLZ84_00740 [Clostridia bacterium]|nr:hypothetical protein [Clostridia bacterium]